MEGYMKEAFLSYSHEDMEKDKILALLNEYCECNIWTDERLCPGTRFTDVIAAKIEELDTFIVLLSKNAMNSDWVKQEISWAFSGGKEIIAIWVEEVRLPKEINFLIHNRHQLYWYSRENDEAFIKEIRKVFPAKVQQTEIEDIYSSGDVVDYHREDRSSSIWGRYKSSFVVSIVIVLVLIVFAFAYFSGTKNTNSTKSQELAKESNTNSTAMTESVEEVSSSEEVESATQDARLAEQAEQLYNNMKNKKYKAAYKTIKKPSKIYGGDRIYIENGKIVDQIDGGEGVIVYPQNEFVYWGKIKNGKADGKGVEIGESYEADGNGDFGGDSYYLLSGSFKDGKANGKCALSFVWKEEKRKITGTYKNGYENGDMKEIREGYEYDASGKQISDKITKQTFYYHTDMGVHKVIGKDEDGQNIYSTSTDGTSLYIDEINEGFGEPNLEYKEIFE